MMSLLVPSIFLVATHDQQSETAAEYGNNQLGTDDLSNFDSDSDDDLLNTIGNDKIETEEATQSNNEDKSLKDNGKKIRFTQ